MLIIRCWFTKIHTQAPLTPFPVLTGPPEIFGKKIPKNGPTLRSHISKFMGTKFQKPDQRISENLVLCSCFSKCLPDSPKPDSPKPDSPKLGLGVRVRVSANRDWTFPKENYCWMCVRAHTARFQCDLYEILKNSLPTSRPQFSLEGCQIWNFSRAHGKKKICGSWAPRAENEVNFLFVRPSSKSHRHIFLFFCMIFLFRHIRHSRKTLKIFLKWTRNFEIFHDLHVIPMQVYGRE